MPVWVRSITCNAVFTRADFLSRSWIQISTGYLADKESYTMSFIIAGGSNASNPWHPTDYPLAAGP